MGEWGESLPKVPWMQRFHAMAKATPPPGCLPTTHSEGINPFQVIGVNYAGPLQHRISRQGERKAYVLLCGGSTWISCQVWKQKRSA